MIVVTGGAGFIGSALVWRLNQHGFDDILIADRLGHGGKWLNINKRTFRRVLHKDALLPWLEGGADGERIEAVFHLGASSSTTETDVDYLVDNNLNYSVRLWRYCAEHQVPFIYASSAATYGAGEQGFHDILTAVPKLRPLNPYGFSKQKFDHWAMHQHEAPPLWAGLKFFNVYGPQEYHKGGQSSVIFQVLPQVQQSGAIKLFKSYRPDYADGGQLRDFVYVKDCVNVMLHFYMQAKHVQSGLYNIGSGQARSFADVARGVFAAMEIDPPVIEYIAMPETIRGQYQYFTEANLHRLREKGGYQAPMTALEAGIHDYVRGYLLAEDRYL